MTNQYCCEAFKQAVTDDDTTEDTGPVIYTEFGEWCLGVMVTPIKFCPFCGAALPDIKDMKEDDR